MLKSMRVMAIAMAILYSKTGYSQTDHITIEITFATTPSSASSSFADLKYNKLGVFNYELDDRSPDTRNLLAFFDGGIAPINGLNYPGKTYTDGCGNTVKWTAAVATNARLQSSNLDWMHYNNCLNWSEMAGLVKKNWMVENHGYYHNKTGTYSFGDDTYNNINENTKYISDSLKAYGVVFSPRVMVVPNSDAGYCAPAERLGYLASVTQNTTDPYPIYPQWIDNSLKVSSLPDGYMVLNRGMTDSYSPDAVSWYKSVISDRFLSDMSSSMKKMWRFGGHYYANSGEFNNFISLMDHLETQSADRVWVTTLQELLEYFETKKKVVKTELLSGNKLIIRLDLSALPSVNFFRDMSLLVNADAGISSVVVTGADRYSYNLSTGLVNVFRKNRNEREMMILPVALQQFTARKSGNAAEIKWVTSFDQPTDFIVERSTNGSGFSEIGRIHAPSASNGIQSFSIRDGNPLRGVNFYRLKYKEAGGQIHYSNVVSLNFGTEGQISIFPNPVSNGQVHLQFDRPVDGRLELFLRSQTGSLVQQKTIPGNQQTDFNVVFDKSISAGTYLLQVRNGVMNETRMVVFK